MRTIAILLVLCLAAAPCCGQDYRPLAAGILAMHLGNKPSPAPVPGPVPTPQPQPGPNPAPSLITCPNCRGKGKVGDGTIMVTCAKCNGSGKVPAAAAAPPVQRYQCITRPDGSRVCVPIPH